MMQHTHKTYDNKSLNIALMAVASPVVQVAGGVERVLCNMANALSLRHHNVTILCHDSKRGTPFYPLEDHVEFFNLNTNGSCCPIQYKFIREVLKLARKLCRVHYNDPVSSWNREQVKSKLTDYLATRNFDVVVAFTPFDSDVLARCKQNYKYAIVQMLHNDPSYFPLETFSDVDVIQVLLPSFKKNINTVCGTPVVVIPNAVESVLEDSMARLDTPKKSFVVTTIGRLDKSQKRQHLLIKAFSILAKQYPSWQVHLYGNANRLSYKRQLQHEILKVGLSSQIKLKGLTSNSCETLRSSDIFAFPSAFEGFGLALAEAMSVGLPCVGFKNCPAVNELIVDGVNGFLAENSVEDFAAKLKLLMDDVQLRVKMGKAGHEMMKQYAPEKIWDQWEELLLQTVDEFQQKRSKKAA